MKVRWFRSLTRLSLLGAGVSCIVGLQAQDSIQFSSVLRLTNNEVALSLSAPTGINYRIDSATNLSSWNGLVTLPISTTTSLQLTDSAAPYLDARFYRAAQLTGSNIFTGDHIPTTNGDVVVHPVGHAAFVMQWNGKTIINDPTEGGAAYTNNFPRPDLMLVSHEHTDHFSAATIAAVRGSNSLIILPQSVFNMLSIPQRTNAIVLTNGMSTNVLEIQVEAIPAYDIPGPGNHPRGRDNGYVLTLGGERIYITGDTDNTPEMLALTNIDVAFVCMNSSFTMTALQATNAVRAFRPKVVYPYHFRESNGTTPNPPVFKQWLGTDLGIEVRLRKWY